MDKIKFALIGCGYWGPNYIRLLSHIKEVSLEVICDLKPSNLSKIENSYWNLKTTTDYKEILRSKDIDAVIVSTPLKTHFKIVYELLESGKNVLCEKPLAYTTDECLQLIELAHKKQLTLSVGQVFEYNSCVQLSKKLIYEKDFGKILYFHFKRTGLGPIREDVNAMWDLASHDISIILNILGELPVSVTAFGQVYIQPKIEDVAFINLEFSNNIICSIHVSWLDPLKVRTMTVVGQNKMLIFDDVSLNEKIKIFDKGVSYQPTTNDYSEFQLSIRDGGIHIPNTKYNEPLKTELEDFIICIKSKQKPLTDGKSGYNVVKVLEAAQKSIENSNSKILL